MSKRKRLEKKVSYAISGSEGDDDSDRDVSFDPTNPNNTSRQNQIQKQIEKHRNITSLECLEMSRGPTTSAQGDLSAENQTSNPSHHVPPILSSSGPSTSNPALARKDSPGGSKFTSYFKIEEGSVDQKKRATCLICKNKSFKMTGRSTTTLKRHLQIKHAQEFFKLYPEESPKGVRQPTIASAFATAKKSTVSSFISHYY